MDERRVGLCFGLAAYGAWGMLPLFWRQLAHVPALDLVFHRVLWAAVVLVMVVAGFGQLVELKRALTSRHLWPTLLLASAFVAINWFTFVYGIETERVVQVSLGYYMNPLLSVLLGTLVLRERLRPLQWLAVLSSALGVSFMALRLGEVPWLSIVLAVTFALYGLVRKTAKVEALVGTAAETILLAPVAGAMVLWLELAGPAHLTGPGATTGGSALLVATGLATALPLLFFANAARRLPLSIVGFLQYVAPTLHLLVAVFAFDEAFTADHAVTFGLIWTGVGLFVMDGLRARPLRAAAPAE